MSGMYFYTRDGRLTTEYADDCVVQYDERDARRLGLPLPGDEPAAKEMPKPADKAVRRPTTKRTR